MTYALVLRRHPISGVIENALRHPGSYLSYLEQNNAENAHRCVVLLVHLLAAERLINTAVDFAKTKSGSIDDKVDAATDRLVSF